MEEVWKDISLASDLPHHHNHPGVILQDFFSKDPPLTAVSSSPPPALPPPPPTILTLNSATDHFSSLLLQPHQPISHMGFDAVVPENNINDGGAVVRKRFPEFDKSSGDRRHKQLEVAHLVEENARLKEQQQQLYIAAAAQQQKKKPPLHRTSTAPF
ncbi:hypothetical protein DH2020_015203 [Rehmannia glutinosa]|uniref:Uncharacterized protein n=1 Tax=Rehmannia glutinosa TaxID=99300 RepID=A0ABR0UTE1_REHGL